MGLGVGLPSAAGVPSAMVAERLAARLRLGPLISADHSPALLTDSQVIILCRLRRKHRTNNVGSAFTNKENFTEKDHALIPTIIPQTGMSVRCPRAGTLWVPIRCKSMFSHPGYWFSLLLHVSVGNVEPKRRVVHALSGYPRRGLTNAKPPK